jgi:hypothetical protein
MKQPRETQTARVGGAWFWLLLIAALIGAFGAAMDFALPRRAPGMLQQPGAATLLGLGAAFAAALAARLLRIVLGRRVREEGADARDRA